MRKEKNIAIALRKKGLSYKQISDKLNLPKSTLSYWLKHLALSKKAKNILSQRVYEKSIQALIRRNVLQTDLAKIRADKIIKEAQKEMHDYVHNKLFLIGVSLYWAEGYKKGAYGSKWKSVDFANSDPAMIKIMMKFFRNICQVNNDKMKIQIIAHPQVNIKESIDYWSKITSIPRSQFNKSSTSLSKSSKSKRKNNNLIHGTIHLRINDVKLFFRIIGWINGLQKCV